MTDGRKEIPINYRDRAAACHFLEQGGIIFFPQSPFRRSQTDTEFLLRQKQQGTGYRKNIAYYPNDNRITGAKDIGAEDTVNLCRIMGEFSLQAQELLKSLLFPYAAHGKIDLASYRPIEEQGRKMRLRARNDLLHVDSFTTRTVCGNRIMRMFENVNPSDNRIWQTSDTFVSLAERFSAEIEPPKPSSLAVLGKLPLWGNIARGLGLPANVDSAYDRWMLGFHNFLKENASFQVNCRKDRWEFPPGSAWICFTDMVSHSVLSGKYAIEQTFIVSQKDLVLPGMAPINVLRRLYPTASL